MDEPENNLKQNSSQLRASRSAPVLRRFTKRQFMIGVALLVATVSVLAVWHHSRHQLPDARKVTNSKTVASSPTARPPTLAEQADKLSFEGHYDQAQKLLDDHIAQSKDKKEQGGLYESKALLALNAKKYDQTLAYAQKAEDLNPTRNSAVLAGNGAEGLGNKRLAADYYKKVLALTPKPNGESETLDYQYYQNKVKQLGG